MINFSGLASGLDTGSIVDQLVSLERSRANVYVEQKSDVNQQISTIGKLSGHLKDLDSLLDDFRDADDIRKTAVTTSSEDRVAVSSDGAATPGNYQLRVSNLAQAETTGSSTYATTDAGVVGTGSVGISVGTDDEVVVEYDSGDSLYEIANRITSSDARVTASVLNDGSNYRILITSEESGEDNAITFTESGDSLGFTADGAELQAAEDAAFTFNGISITRSSNTFSDLVDGVTVSLRGEHQSGEADTVVQVDQDLEATKEKLQGFVDKYNKIHDLVAGEMSYNGTQKSGASLFGDSTLRLLQRNLASVLTDSYENGSGETSLGLVGIEMSNAGRLSIDSTKLEETLSDDPEALDNIFSGSGGSDGLSKTLQDLVDSYTRAGDGFLSGKKEALNSRIKVFDDQIERIEESASRLGETLNRQFTALERAMSELTSQQQYLSSMGL